MRSVLTRPPWPSSLLDAHPFRPIPRARGILRVDASVTEHVKRRKLKSRECPSNMAPGRVLPSQAARFDESASTKHP